VDADGQLASAKPAGERGQTKGNGGAACLEKARCCQQASVQRAADGDAGKDFVAPFERQLGIANGYLQLIGVGPGAVVGDDPNAECGLEVA
jgi:hypothetical protein